MRTAWFRLSASSSRAAIRRCLRLARRHFLFVQRDQFAGQKRELFFQHFAQNGRTRVSGHLLHSF